MSQSRRPAVLALLLFGLALVPRLPGLGRFITTDEHTNIFIAGSDVLAAFLSGNLRGTYWHFYPGVTMSWLTDIGLVGQFGVEKLLGRPVPPLLDFIYSDILTVLVAARLPFALLTALAVALVYWLARRLFSEPAALLGALLLAFDPFFLAHSRVNHGDAPVAVFMVLSLLALLVFVQQPSASLPPARGSSFIPCPLQGGHPSSFLLLSAASGGLAALTKAPGQFMAVFVVGLSLLLAALQIWREGQPARPVLRRWLAVIAVWGVVSLATFVLLWPSMWVDPLGTLRQMLTETFGKVEAGHLVYFLGQPALDPGPWFYSLVIPLRLTPLALLGAALSVLFFVPKLHSRSEIAAPGRASHGLSPLFLLWLFVVSLLLFGNLSPKKQDRYLLPLFPVLDLLAAVGWWGLINLAAARLSRRSVVRAAALALVLLHAVPVITYYPYYLAYFNPLLGGPKAAAQTTLIGWGEGMEQVAAYLNTKPNADQLYVAATPSQALLPFFKGRGENFYTNDVAFRADYVVLYIAQMQRLAPSPEIVRYFEAQSPEKEIEIAGLTYAKIYPNIRRILADIPLTATPANIGLEDKIRLAGYTIGPQSLSLTLYWHALAPLATDYTVSVRAYAADGRRLAQQDQWPVDGLLPTSQWRQGDYVADTHLLEFAPADTPLVDHWEVVVYDAVSGQTLGQLEITNDE